MTQDRTGYPDLHDHLDALKARGLLQVIARPIDKDSELHPLLRWQFVGGGWASRASRCTTTP